MMKIGNVIREVEDDEIRFARVNAIIVSASHDIYDRYGSRGHIKRQQIRKRLWLDAQKRYPVLRRYVIPREISRDNRCQIKRKFKQKISWAEKTLSLVKKFFKRLIDFFLGFLKK
jgi:hypothetical protein